MRFALPLYAPYGACFTLVPKLRGEALCRYRHAYRQRSRRRAPAAAQARHAAILRDEWLHHSLSPASGSRGEAVACCLTPARRATALMFRRSRDAHGRTPWERHRWLREVRRAHVRPRVYPPCAAPYRLRRWRTPAHAQMLLSPTVREGRAESVAVIGEPSPGVILPATGATFQAQVNVVALRRGSRLIERVRCR